MIFGLVALVLLGKLLDSATALVRLLRPPETSVAIGSGPDAEPSDAGAVPADGARSAVTPPPRRTAAPVAAIEEELDAQAPAPSPTEVSPADAAAPPSNVEVEKIEPAQEKPPEPVRCGWRYCPTGQVCCNWNCSFCVDPGGTCPLFCGAPSIPISVPCGRNTCNVSEICCNLSCGICVPPGGTCSQAPCEDNAPYYPTSPNCGMNTCNVGQFCCNPSCGLCKDLGETCSLEPCP
jgi:hypothetical protein